MIQDRIEKLARDLLSCYEPGKGAYARDLCPERWLQVFLRPAGLCEPSELEQHRRQCPDICGLYPPEVLHQQYLWRNTNHRTRQIRRIGRACCPDCGGHHRHREDNVQATLHAQQVQSQERQSGLSTPEKDTPQFRLCPGLCWVRDSGQVPGRIRARLQRILQGSDAHLCDIRQRNCEVQRIIGSLPPPELILLLLILIISSI